MKIFFSVVQLSHGRKRTETFNSSTSQIKYNDRNGLFTVLQLINAI